MDILLLFLLIIILGASLLCLEVEDKILMLLLLVLFSSVLGLTFIYVGALFAGIFQLIIYAGVMTVLFIAIVYLTDDTSEPDGGMVS